MRSILSLKVLVLTSRGGRAAPMISFDRDAD
jgi:hypothetical protein